MTEEAVKLKIYRSRSIAKGYDDEESQDISGDEKPEFENENVNKTSINYLREQEKQLKNEMEKNM